MNKTNNKHKQGHLIVALVFIVTLNLFIYVNASSIKVNTHKKNNTQSGNHHHQQQSGNLIKSKCEKDRFDCVTFCIIIILVIF
jgi:hypothetical protein